MANEQNLIPFSERAESEQREIRSKGGKARAEKIRRNAPFKEIINAMLNENGGEYQGEEITKKQRIAIKALKYLLDENELDAREFAKMFEVVRDTIGEKPIDRLQVTEINPDDIAEVEAIVLDDETASGTVAEE